MITFELALLLGLIALIGGICITTIGPGGIFVTIALFLLLDLDPSTVAGTASLTFIGTGLLGSAAYLKSGELRVPGAFKGAAILGTTSVIGAFAGTVINPYLEKEVFGALLGGFVLFVGLIILYRQRFGLGSKLELDLKSRKGLVLFGLTGLLVGLPGGLLGVGGPVLAVPLLILLGVPMLVAVGLAQVQSVFISLFATIGYGMQGAIDWSLGLLIGIPLLVGTYGGWWIAGRSNPERLKEILAVVLSALGIYLLVT